MKQKKNQKKKCSISFVVFFFFAVLKLSTSNYFGWLLSVVRVVWTEKINKHEIKKKVQCNLIVEIVKSNFSYFCVFYYWFLQSFESDQEQIKNFVLCCVFPSTNNIENWIKFFDTVLKSRKLEKQISFTWQLQEEPKEKKHVRLLRL
jgi:hypothetical protein